MRRGTRTFMSALAGFLVVAAGFPLGSAPVAVAQGSTSLVISQVYGGGGNTGAPAALYTHDFIEVFNRSQDPVSLAGWSVQYTAAAGTSWQTTALSGAIEPGQYYLVQQAQGAAGTSPLPTPDATGTIQMAAAAGKVALVSATTPLSGSCPTLGVIDFVGYGSTANCFEGTGPTATLNNNTSAVRLGAGCTDSDDNAADFTTASPPMPRNSASPPDVCGDPGDPSAEPFALWTFEGATSEPAIDLTGNAAASTGSGLSGVGFVAGNPLPGGTPGSSWTASNWALTSSFDATKYFEFKVDLTGHEDVNLSFAERRSGTGPLNFEIHYSTDGASFALIDGTVSVLGNDLNWRSHSFDFSQLNAQVSGESAVHFRIFGHGAGGTGGTWRIDDVAFSGTELDAPPPTGSDVVISEFRVRGPAGGNDEFVELYNRSGSAVAIGGWLLRGSNNAGTVGTRATISAGVVIQPGCYYLLTNSAAGGYSGSVPGDQTFSTGITDDGGVAITLPDTTPVDQVGLSAGSAFGEGTRLTSLGSSNQDRGFERRPGGVAGNGQDTDDNAADFQLISPSNPQNSSSPCIGEAPTNPSGVGAANPSTVEAGDNTLLTVTVSPGTNPTTTDLAVRGDLSAIGGSATQTFFDDGSNGDLTAGDLVFSYEATVDPATSAGANSLPITITDDEDRTGSTTISLTVTVTEDCGEPFTPIYDIQGSGATTPRAGQNVSTEGVVIGAYEGPSPALRGLYIQDPEGDVDEATSDGIFVFNANNVSGADVGDLVRVSGRAEEFQDQTQIGFVSSIQICESGWEIEPTEVHLPVPAPVGGVDYLERFEGMLVRLPQTLYVTEHFQLGRFGQVTMSSGDRLFQPTNVVLPGAPASAMQAANDLNRIIIDDDLQNQNRDPIVFGRGGNELTASNTLRGGDSASGIVGVMTYTWAGQAASGNAWRVRPETAMAGGVPDFQPTNPRPAQAPAVGGTLRVSNFNVLNYFNSFSGCTGGVGGLPMDCRGATNATEFERQTAKIVTAIVGLNADVVGLMEVENDGYGPNSAIAELVDRLNAATAPGTWAFVDADALTGQLNSMGTDAIKNGFIYRPAAVTPVGTTSVLNTVAFVNGGDPAPRNRPTLTQAFRQNASGESFIASVHHLKSKGSACSQPDQGDGQGNCNQVRLNAVNELLAWLETDPTGTGDPDVLILGDLNSYAREDPIRALEDAGFTNLAPHFLGDHAYSFVFDAQWGALDHAMASLPLLAQVTGVSEWHINSDEPNVLDYNTDFKTARHQQILFAPDEFRSSDHDPLVIGLQLTSPDGKVSGNGAFAEGTFSVNVQYRANSVVPTGNTTLNVGGHTFVSSSYAWLVAGGDRAVYQGTGSLNGVAGYGFFVSVHDGGLPGAGNDRIRVRIWELDGSFVYDTQPGEHISAAPLQVLTSGNLKVH